MRLCTHRSRGVFMRISSLTVRLAAAAGVLFLPVSAGAQPADAAPTQGTAYLNRQMTALAERHGADGWRVTPRSEEHTSELQSLMRISYAVFCLKKKITLIL